MLYDLQSSAHLPRAFKASPSPGNFLQLPAQRPTAHARPAHLPLSDVGPLVTQITRRQQSVHSWPLAHFCQQILQLSLQAGS